MRATKRKKTRHGEIAVLAQVHGGRCAICGFPLHAHEVERDHIVPLALGGRDVLANKRLVHAICNRARGKKLA